MWNKLKPGKKIIFNFASAKLVDHTFQEALHHFEEDYHSTGGSVLLTGLERHHALSQHPLATRKPVIGLAGSGTIELNARAKELSNYGEAFGFNFFPQRVKTG